MNHSAVAPLPARTARALQEWIGQAQVSVGEDWQRWSWSLSHARKNAAALLHCSADQVAFIHNTTHGLLIVANSLPWRPGDNVLTAEHEFPANVYPWRNLLAQGVATRVVPEREGRFRVEDFLERIDARTRLVAVSMVQYSTGFRMPIEDLSEICRNRGILLCVDGIQALGAMPVDVERLGCDFFSADGHKWMLSAEGLGVLYIRPEAMAQMNDSMTGWIGRVKPADYADTNQPLVQTAKRFEEGSHAMSLAVALESSTGLLLEVGQPEIWNRIEALTGRLSEGLLARGFRIVSSRRDGERSGIVAFTSEGVDSQDWMKRLIEQKIFIAARRGFLRVSPHFYNTAEQIDRLLGALSELR